MAGLRLVFVAARMNALALKPAYMRKLSACHYLRHQLPD
jgi:hypothetical protein